jgi:hypothetical protein
VDDAAPRLEHRHEFRFQGRPFGGVPLPFELRVRQAADLEQQPIELGLDCADRYEMTQRSRTRAITSRCMAKHARSLLLAGGIGITAMPAAKNIHPVAYSGWESISSRIARDAARPNHSWKDNATCAAIGVERPSMSVSYWRTARHAEEKS